MPLSPLEFQQSRNIQSILLLFCWLVTSMCGFAPFIQKTFFAAHLEQFTGVEFEEGINVIEKAAGYPDLHGDYPACAVMKLSEKNFARLASEKIINGYEEIEPNKASGLCLESVHMELEHLYYKEAPGEIIYWGYNSKTLEVYFDYYSH
jgi:hypothetical protein